MTDARHAVVDLRVDGLTSPLGLGERRPELSWRIESNGRDVYQRAYRVIVATDPGFIEAGTADVWDSGRVEFDGPAVRYDGPTLESRVRYWWAVDIETTDGADTGLSAPSWWEMGLLDAADWTAGWIAAENDRSREDREFGLTWIWGDQPDGSETCRFRYAFELRRPADSGELLLMAQDWWLFIQITSVWLDGVALCDEPWTGYENAGADELRRHIRKIIPLRGLGAGRHVIAVEVRVDPDASLETFGVRVPVVGAVTGRMRLVDEDGVVTRLGTSTGWRTSTGDDAGWHAPGFDDSAWRFAIEAPLTHQPWPAAPARQLRTEFELPAQPTRARLYATALGAYEARINGARVGRAELAPGPAQYAERVRYQVHDVTDLLAEGANALGLVVGDGWYGSFDGRFAWALPPLRVLAQLELTFADGSRRVVATGPDWRAADGPIRSSEMKGGEVHDARLEQDGWDRPGLDDGEWDLAEAATDPRILLDADPGPPIAATDELRPVEVRRTDRGSVLVDFGRDFTGWCRLTVTGRRGASILARHGQKLLGGDSGGGVDELTTRDGVGGPRNDTFILRGDPGGETFEPRFTFRSFRYVEIEGLDGALAPDAITGVFVHSDLERTGTIESSSELVRRIHENIVQTQRSAFLGVQLDNGIRECRGYTGEMGPFSHTAFFNMDLRPFVRRWMTDIVDDQKPDGALPIAAPEPRESTSFCRLDGSAPGWGEGAIVMAWTAWQHSGDTRFASDHWDAMRRHVDFIARRNPEFLWLEGRHYDFGDWLSLDETPKDIVATAEWAYALGLMAEMATAIGRDVEATELADLRQHVVAAFTRAHVRDDGLVGTGTQTAQVFALALGLLPEELRSHAADRLVENIRRFGHLTTGTLGTAFLLDVLAETGHGAVAYDLLLKETKPSWGHMVRNGATAIWEDWEGRGSLNQPAFGSIGGFLFRRVAGIRATSPGFRTIEISPLLDPRLSSGGGDYRSVLGPISTRWEATPDGYRLRIVIPPLASAAVILPDGGRVEVGSGRHEFTAGPPAPDTGYRLRSA